MPKPGAWEEYNKASDEIASEADIIIEDDKLSNETGMENKIKYKAFGKTKPMTKAATKNRLGVTLKAVTGMDYDAKVKEVMRKWRSR